jgi:hypothetical protein
MASSVVTVQAMTWTAQAVTHYTCNKVQQDDHMSDDSIRDHNIRHESIIDACLGDDCQ